MGLRLSDWATCSMRRSQRAAAPSLPTAAPRVLAPRVLALGVLALALRVLALLALLVPRAWLRRGQRLRRGCGLSLPPTLRGCGQCRSSSPRCGRRRPAGLRWALTFCDPWCTQAVLFISHKTAVASP